jgi:hypothetical protein
MDRFNPQPDPPKMGLLLPAVQATAFELDNVLVSSYSISALG